MRHDEHHDEGRDGCALCAGDCRCGADHADLSDEERRQLWRDQERAAEIFRAAGRPVPAWVHARR